MRMTVPVISALVLAFIAVFICADLSDADPVYSYSDGKLTVTEDVPDYADSSETPWALYLGDITRLVVSDGVRSIGSKAFSGCPNLTTVTIESSLTSVATGHSTIPVLPWRGSI